MTPEQAAALRAPFPASAIGQIPRAGVKLDYVGHAAVTDRLLAVDPEWTWEPFAIGPDGAPAWRVDGETAVMWIRLTVAGVTRPGVGLCKADAFELEKQLISDALRNAAMRFGVALDLWSKEDLDAGRAEPLPGNAPAAGDGGEAASRPTPASPPQSEMAPQPSKFRREKARERVAILVAHKISVADERTARGLPTVEKADAVQLKQWEAMLDHLERLLPAVRS